MDSSSSRYSSEFSSISYISADTSNSLSSVSFLSDSGRSARRDPLKDLKLLLDLLFLHGVPGPYLLRVKQEFNLCTGEGGEGTIYEASFDLACNLTLLTAKAQAGRAARIRESANTWRACVIKQLRSDGDRPLAFQTNSAKTEINILSKFRHPHIVTLLGWALCLDSLENPTSSTPRLPLLVLEKAQYDLRKFLDGVDYDNTSHEDLCAICLGIGRGLQALHEGNISHGDVKPGNVLVFERYTSNNDPKSIGRWVPKLCDFGLATAFEQTSQPSNTLRYKGTAGWKPPEAYLELPPKTFQLCDIFAYGLVVWCVFIGVASSPICIRGNQDEESAATLANLGQQTYYRSASQSIRRAYDLVQDDLHLALSELVDDTINFGTGPGMDKRLIRTRRKAYLLKPVEIREAGINRALTVLRESLNDDPIRRHQRPWELMDIERVETVGSVQDPPRYSTKRETKTKKRFYYGLAKSCSDVISQLSESKDRAVRRANHNYSQRRRQITLSLIAFISTWLPWLLPQNPKQQVYDRIYSNFESRCRDEAALRSDSRPYSFEASGIESFEHKYGEDRDPCHSLTYLYTLLKHALESVGRGPSDDEVLYSFARIRSRVKLCCWRQYLQSSVLADQRLGSSSSSVELAMEQERLLFVFVSCRKEIETLAWLCRGEVAKVVLEQMQEDPVGLWGWIGVHDPDLNRVTAKLALLLERGCNIGQKLLCNGSERSPFRWYLESLPEQYNSLALNVCRQFRRIAADEDVNQFARFYLMGQSPDVRDDELFNERDFSTTALHDAVMASNYDVVEYLVRTEFIVNVQDDLGRTALHLAESLAQSLSNDRDAAKHIKNNQIIALLRQSKTTPSYRNRANALPIGWEEVKSDEPFVPTASGEQLQPDETFPVADCDQAEDDVPLMPSREGILSLRADGASGSIDTSRSFDTITGAPEVETVTKDNHSSVDYNTHKYMDPKVPPVALPTIQTHDVLFRNNEDSCYVTIGANVYDVTPFLRDHPGGVDLILGYGGQDISKIMGDELSHSHSEAAYERLKEYLIGFLPNLEIVTDMVKHEIPKDNVPLLPNTNRLVVQKASGTGGELPQSKPILAATSVSGVEDLTKEPDLNADYEIHRFLNLNQSLLPQLWNGRFSKDFYLQQVHRPRYYTGGGSAPLFGNFLEPLTKSPWWVIPILWLPPVVYGTHLAWGMLSPTQTARYWLVGYLLWPLIEYMVHRFIFHCDRYLPDKRLAITIHFLIHGLHHYLPMDKYRLVRPPALGLILAFPLYLLAHRIFFWDWYVATAVVCGATFGYICFEITHYFLHHKQLPSYHRQLKLYHMQHHYADYENGFGVTTQFWDRVFGTELQTRVAKTA